MPTGEWSFVVIHTFEGGEDGAWPYKPLTLSKEGNLYGAAANGGLAGC
ncbi:MAG: hypothetical protein H0X25_03175 [Acidobacteriales bacterium]|nr:hypothetical protein [Terriglobales bacterium]